MVPLCRAPCQYLGQATTPSLYCLSCSLAVTLLELVSCLASCQQNGVRPTSFVSLQTLYISGAAVTGDVCICALRIGGSIRDIVCPFSACICNVLCKTGEQLLQTRLGSKVHSGCDNLALKLDKVYVVVGFCVLNSCVQY